MQVSPLVLGGRGPHVLTLHDQGHSWYMLEGQLQVSIRKMEVANNLCLPEQPQSIMVSKHVFALFPGVGHVVLNILSFVLIIFCIMVSKLTVSWSGS